MSTVSIMQPYFLPYLGYFQLMAAADVFIVYDTIQYTKQTWINRNRMLMNGEARYFSIPVQQGEHHLFVNQRLLAAPFDAEARHLVRLFENAYRKAPFFAETMPLLERIFQCPERNLFAYILNSLQEIRAHLSIGTPLHIASAYGDFQTTGVDRVIELTRAAGGTVYRNPNGAAHLYQRPYFEARGLGLEILKMNPVVYPQFEAPFVPSLSVADVLFFNGRERTRALLNAYHLLETW